MKLCCTIDKVISYSTTIVSKQKSPTLALSAHKHYMRKLLFGLILFTTIQATAQQAFQNKIKVLHTFLQKQHYSPAVWSDTLANTFFDKWLATLDEEKMFFTAQDISALSAYKTGLAAEVQGKKGAAFFEASTKIFFARAATADSLVKAITGKAMDYSKADDLSWPHKNFAANAREVNTRWQKYLKWQVLSSIAGEAEDSLELAKNFPALIKEKEVAVRARVAKKEATYFAALTEKEAVAKMQNAFLDDIAWCYDPHSNYLDMSARREFDALVSASEYTVGLDLRRGDKGELLIEYLVPGGSAWRSGKLHAGDQVMKIQSGKKEHIVAGMEDEEIGNLFAGTENDKIAITVKTEAGEQRKVDLLFEKITDEESVVKSYVIKSTQNIGYINLPGFYSRDMETGDSYDGCANDVSKEIIKLKKDKIAALILDLRDNGGGSVWEAMQLAGIFLDIGPVATIKSTDGKQSILKDPNRGSIYDGPMIVLINGGSASASEFMAAALQDNNRAIIMGETSYGKGTAQVVMPMDTLPPSASKKYEDFVKVTNGKFYRINGNTVQWSAVQPDISVPSLYADSRSREKDIPTALVPDLSKKALYTALPVLPIPALAAKSKARIQANKYYKLVGDFNKWAKEYETTSIIPLQQDAYAANYDMVLKKVKAFVALHERDSVNTITVSNNSFDGERMKKSSEKEKEINEILLSELKKDNLIFEAGLVFTDWWLLL